MKLWTRAHAASAFLALSVAACGGSDDAGPTRLYLALLDSELTVQLVEEEPQPF